MIYNNNNKLYTDKEKFRNNQKLNLNQIQSVIFRFVCKFLMFYVLYLYKNNVIKKTPVFRLLCGSICEYIL